MGQDDGRSEWWKHAVIYQVAPRSFCDSDGDGLGDLGGLLQHIDHFAWLGVDAVWLCPIQPTPGRDFGYDISDFCAVAPELGTMAELDELVAGLHRRGIRLLLDFVPNHTADDHPWFLASCSSREDPKRDWYVWQDEAADGGPPNNWLSRFGGSAWEWHAATGQYYYHAFLKEQPDLNWRNPAVRTAMHEVLRFWMRRGIDGFRVDAAAVLAEDDLLRDDPPSPDAGGLPPPNRFTRAYSDDRPETLGYMEELRAVADEFAERVLLAEVDVASGDPGRFYGGEKPRFHLPLNYALLDNRWDADTLGAAIDGYLAAVKPHGWPNWAIGSHDKPRIASKLGRESAGIAAVLLFTLPGSAIFYQGDEIGMPDVDVPQDRQCDPFGILVPGHGLGRDRHRTPMRWTPSLHAGFTSGEPWLPVGRLQRGDTVAEQAADQTSLLHLYRDLIAFRKAALSPHDLFQPRRNQAGVMLFERSGPHGRFLVAANLSGARRLVDLERPGRVAVATIRQRKGTQTDSRLEMLQGEALVLRLAPH